MKVAFKVEGGKELGKLLRQLPDEIVNRHMKAAFNRLMKRAVQAARENMMSTGAVFTGSLMRSISSKVKFYKKSSVLYAIVGPDTSFWAMNSKGKVVVPWRYAHLVEAGTTKMPPRPFLGPAIESISGELVPELRKAFTRAVKRLAKK